MDSNNEEDKIDIIENKLRELREQIQKMEKENAELCNELGIGPHQVEELLNDRTRFSKAAYEQIEKERQTLQETLEKRINTSRAKIKRDAPPEHIGGHWIYVR